MFHSAVERAGILRIFYVQAGGGIFTSDRAFLLFSLGIYICASRGLTHVALYESMIAPNLQIVLANTQ